MKVYPKFTEERFALIYKDLLEAELGTWPEYALDQKVCHMIFIIRKEGTSFRVNPLCKRAAAFFGIKSARELKEKLG